MHRREFRSKEKESESKYLKQCGTHSKSISWGPIKHHMISIGVVTFVLKRDEIITAIGKMKFTPLRFWNTFY